MPRMARVVLPGYPHHIVQRGHNRQVVFAQPNDYIYYLDTLQKWKSEYSVRVYAYCLMTNHIHLILESDNAAAIGQLMKRLAGRQTRYVNRQESRSGTLWEGRYKSSPIDTDNYLLACCRYLELNPVRARMVSIPEDYRWSSYHCHAYGYTDPVVTIHRHYQALAKDDHARQKRYRGWFRQRLSDEQLSAIRSGV
jgi:putative transposase